MPDSTVITVMRQWKAALLRDERAQMQEMARRWLGVERRLMGQMEALAWQMDAIKRDGGTVSRELLMDDARYRQLLVQLTGELERYSDYTARTIADRQRQLARLGIAHAENAITAQGITAGFNRLPVEAVEYMVGLTGSGSPLRTLIAQSWPLAADGLTQELINGVALGYNPRKTARLMAQAATGSLDRMMVISRTETLRVYRQANRESYLASGVVNAYKRLATHDARVCAACLMDEGHTYELGEEMPEHPQGRCTMVPLVEGMPSPKWQLGREWFEEQPDSTQRDILGKGRYYAWQNGDFDLGEIVTVKPNPIWGPSIAVTPLTELVGA